MDTGTLLAKVNKYKQVLENTEKYRIAWHSEVKPMLAKTLEMCIRDRDNVLIS